jgi:hypothetical protein
MISTRDRWNGARFNPRDPGGHYESWFQRANDPSGNRAFWIRYTIFSPRERPEDAVGELWAIWFEKEPRRIVAVKEVKPVAQCAFAVDKLDVTIGNARLDDTSLRGSAATVAHAIAWDLRYEGGQEPLLLLSERLYARRLPRAKALVGRPLAKFAGTITVDGTPIALDGWRGSQNHNWGSRHTDRYAWGQVAGFDEDPDAFLECSTARLRIGPVWTPWMSPVVLRLGGETLGWNSLPRAIRSRGNYKPYDWRIDTSSEAGTLELHLHANAADFVALNYGNPPGGTKICLNSKLARCELTLRRPGKPVLRLHSPCAAFEILDDLAPAGVRPEV